MSKIPGIYKLQIGPYIYIGQSVDCKNRIKQHKYSLIKNKHSNSYMQNVYNKYQIFSYKVLFKVEKEFLTIMEQICINYYNSDYILNIAAADQLIRTDKWKKSISEAHKTSEKAKKARAIIHAKAKGQKLNLERYKNVCEANSKRKGIGHTKETKIKMSITRRNDKNHLERIRQLGLSMRGENNPKYQSQEYIFFNKDINDFYEGTRVNFRNYLGKSYFYNGNITKLLNGKQKTFFGYKLLACKLPKEEIL